jgi:predicted PurR-regulated permease PerM
VSAVPAPPPTPDRITAVSVRTVLRIVLVIIGVAFALWLIYLLRKPLTWIFIAGFIAVALAGPVNYLERRMRRGLAIAVVYIGLILVPVLIAASLVPPIVEQLNNLINNLPGYVDDLRDFVEKNDQLRKIEQDYNITAELQKQASSLTSRVGDAAGILSDIGLGLVNSIFAGVTILIMSLFIIGSGRSWLNWFADRHDPERSEWMRRLFDRIGNAVGNYVAGALAQALVAGVLSYIVLLILGVPYAGSLAVVIFLLDLVPLVGATLGAILVGLITLFNDFPTDTIIWVIWSVVYQQVENTIIQPRIQAKAVQVHPFVVLTSVLFGSTLFGVLGALLAIPVAAAIQISIIEYANLRRPENIGAVQAPPPEDDEPPPPDAGPEPAPA